VPCIGMESFRSVDSGRQARPGVTVETAVWNLIEVPRAAAWKRPGDEIRCASMALTIGRPCRPFEPQYSWRMMCRRPTTYLGHLGQMSRDVSRNGWRPTSDERGGNGPC
jgi:hypothetical protein